MDDQIPPTTNDELSDRQVKVLAALTICSASLSVIGSYTIVYKILHELAHDRSRYLTAYDRIILGLSTCDILSSFTYAVFQFLLPMESGDVWAFGNSSTCQVIGFFQQLWPFWAIWYNCILSYYFLLTVLSKVRMRNLVPKYEKWMHLSGLYFPITAVMGYPLGWYDREYPCWITDPVVGWVVGGIPVAFTNLSLIVNNSVIYVLLRKSLRPTSEQEQIKKEAVTLMFLYVGFFFVTTSPPFAAQMLEYYYTDNDRVKLYPLYVLRQLLMPLQGFFNVFIYFKPAYTRFRAANPEKPVYFVLHQAVFNSRVPQLRPTNNTPNANSNDPPNAIAEGDVYNPNQALFDSSFPSDPSYPSLPKKNECVIKGESSTAEFGASTSLNPGAD